MEALVHMFQQDPELFIVLALFLVSEILGSSEKFKSNSLFQVFRNIVNSMFAAKFSKNSLEQVEPEAKKELPPEKKN